MSESSAASAVADRLVFVLGAPRSGTSWIAKILDSHPDVLYRHEPDTDLRDRSIPNICEPFEFAAHLTAARAYVERLRAVRTLRSWGGMPVFPKNYLPAYAPGVRLVEALLLRGAERLPGVGRLARTAPIPDFVDPRRNRPACKVIKSVSALGRAGLFAAAVPEARYVLILRHPCGQVGSTLRGVHQGRFESAVHIEGSATSRFGSRFGLSPGSLHRMPLAEFLAWEWGILNSLALEQLRDAAHLKILRHEDACLAPEAEARSLLDFAGLDWHPQTARFVADSTSHDGPDRYYDVFRSSAAAADRWRRELSPDLQDAILAIARRTPAGRMFTDPQG
ncbi:MAG: sulfotransferase [Acetobacteraceae bacterium]|nr:sulfotransferase [Acetobacteraceae bacterium]